MGRVIFGFFSVYTDDSESMNDFFVLKCLAFQRSIFICITKRVKNGISINNNALSI